MQERRRQEKGDPEDMPKVIELSKIVEDLLNLNQTFSQSESVFLNTARRKVFRHGHAILKFGLDVSLLEAKTLQFMGETTNVPVPRLYCNYVHSDGTVVIAMEHVEGKILSELWPRLCSEEKIKLVGQLREILKEMRQYQSDVIGGVHDTPAVDIRRFRHTGGPFPTEEKFNEFLRSDMISAAPRIYRSMLEGAMKNNHDIVLTHGDISPQNIIVNNGQIVAILDWESAGWYPEYWEYVKFFNAVDPALDWLNYADKIFSKTYHDQFLVDSFLGQWLLH